MIKNIIGDSFITVSSSSGFMPYVNMSNVSAGMVRFNGNTTSLEVYDGLSWLPLNADCTSINLAPTAVTAINWAMKKMTEEAQLEIEAKTNPAIKAAYENLKRAAEQLKTTIILSKNEEASS